MSKVVSKITKRCHYSGTYEKCVDLLANLERCSPGATTHYDILPDWKSWSEEREKIVG